MSETARQRSLQRTLTRTTLTPAVQDFNGNIITKGLDEDSAVWVVGKSNSKIVPSTDYCFPVPASFRKGGPFAHAHWEGSRATSLPPSLSSTPVPTTWSEEIHRRHVARTARARARISPKQKMSDRIVPSYPIYSVYDDDSAFSLSLPLNGECMEFDARLTSQTRTPTPKPHSTARPRPATTGRYFDSSNGLRNSRSRNWRSRPSTAGQWPSGPGLRIQKLTLHDKGEWEESYTKRPLEGLNINSMMIRSKVKA